MIYGEGTKAFQRLQEAIIRSSTDQTFLAWRSSSARSNKVLADAPFDFKEAGRIVRYAPRSPAPRQPDFFELTNAGIRIKLPLVHIESESYVLFDAKYEDDFDNILGFRVEVIQESDGSSESEAHVTTVAPLRNSRRTLKTFNLKTLEGSDMLQRIPLLLAPKEHNEAWILANGIRILVHLDGQCSDDLEVLDVRPESHWNSETNVLSWSGSLFDAESTARVVLGHPRISNRRDCYDDPQMPGIPSEKFYIVLAIRVRFLENLDQICSFRADRWAELPDGDDLDEMETSTGTDWVSLTNKEVGGLYEIASFAESDGLPVRVTTSRRYPMSVPVYVVSVASNRPRR